MKKETKNKLDHLWGPLVGIAVNAGVVFALLVYVNMGGAEAREVTQVKHIEQKEREEIEEIEEIEIPEEEEPLEEIQEDIEFTMDDVSMELDVSMETEEIENAVETDVAELANLMSDIDSPVTMSDLLAGRTQLGRKAALGRFGGGLGGKTEPAAMKALRWLKDHQKKSGAWSRNGSTDAKGKDAGTTGLALLAFLSHGETPDSVEFGETVTKALQFLLSVQQSDGKITMGDSHYGYAHAIATYAISEAYNMTDLPQLEKAMESGIDVIMKGQQENGGYMYKYDTGPAAPNDSSLAAWQIQAMKAALLAGARNPGLKQSINKAIGGMLLNSRKIDESSRSIGYRGPRGEKHAVTAAGLLGMQLAGRKNDAEARELLNRIRPWSPGRPGTYNVLLGEMYLWYYVAQAKFQADAAAENGKIFAEFNPLAAKWLLSTQKPDGHWVMNKGKEPTLGTAMGALTLMVYYRHLPTSQAVSGKPPVMEEVEEEDEDAVEFLL